MTRTLRRLARGAAVAVVALLGLPVSLLVPAAIFDVGPGGRVRASLFPMALTLWDPFVWACARDSLIVAGIVAAVSLPVGVGLARIVGPWRFWGRPVLAALAWLPLAMVPAVAALGLVQEFPTGRIGRALTGSTGGAMPLETPWDVWVGWGLLVWAELVPASVLVALSAKAALGRVDPAWSDAGRALGASRGRAWRQLVWPIVRPEVARTSAAVFATAFLDPGAPLVLGLRRTLPFQIVEAVARGDAPARTAALALLGLALALLGRGLIRWWGGPRIDVDPHRLGAPARASWSRAALASVGLAAWIAFALTPLAGLVAILFESPTPGARRGWVVGLTSVVYALIDPDTGRLWRNALGLGLAATALAGLIAAGLSRPPYPRPRGRPARPSLLLLAFERTPALIFGVALGLVPSLLSMAGSGLGMPGLLRLASALEPARWPGVLLVAATAAVRLPTLARGRPRRDPVAAGAGRPGAEPGGVAEDALRFGGGRGPGRGVLVLTFALAATAVAPAIVLAPTMRTRPVGPALALLADDRPRASALALGSVALNLLGLVAARRSRSGPPGDWLRG